MKIGWPLICALAAAAPLCSNARDPAAPDSNQVLKATAVAQGRAEDRCHVTEQQLAGAWQRSGDAGFFEEFELVSSGGSHTFNSWADQRPELSGANWRLEHCELTITPQQQEFPPFQFKVELKQGKLHLYDEADHVASVYVRTAG